MKTMKIAETFVALALLAACAGAGVREDRNWAALREERRAELPATRSPIGVPKSTCEGQRWP